MSAGLDGIANQRETIVLWDRLTGVPVEQVGAAFVDLATPDLAQLERDAEPVGAAVVQLGLF